MALLRSLGSIHILSLLGLATVAILDTQSVASLTGASIFSCTFLSYSHSCSLKVTGTLQGGCMTGFPVGLISMC